MSSSRLARLLKNRMLLGGALLAAVLIAIAAWPTSVAVDVAPVQHGPLQVTVDEEGETRVRERFVVSAPVSGRVLRIELEPGDRVAGGAVVATIEPAPSTPLDPRARAEASARVEAAQAAVGRARAERQRARATRDLAAAEARRARELSDVISLQERELRESQSRIAEEELKAAEFAVRTAEEELRVARAQLLPPGTPVRRGEPVTVRSPAEGVVLKRMRESEAVVAAGEPLLELGNPNQLEIVSDLLSIDAVKVRRGNEVRIEQWGGDRVLRGRVRLVEPSGFTKISALGVEEQRVNVIVDFADPVEAWEALGDGYRVEVRIVIWEGDRVLKVPTSSMFRTRDGFAVFVVQEGRARQRPVKVGQRSDTEAEVLGGLEANEMVVVHPPDTLVDDLRITIREG